jgi:hypothetical protein
LSIKTSLLTLQRCQIYFIVRIDIELKLKLTMGSTMRTILKIWVIIIALCGFVVATGDIVGNRIAGLSAAKETQAMAMMDKNHRAALPAIDKSLPARIETATFALG